MIGNGTAIRRTCRILKNVVNIDDVIVYVGNLFGFLIFNACYFFLIPNGQNHITTYQ